MLNNKKFELSLKEIQKHIKNNHEIFTKYSFENIFTSLIFSHKEIVEFISEKDKYKLVSIEKENSKNSNDDFKFIFNTIDLDKFIEFNFSKVEQENKFFVDIKNKIIYPLYMLIYGHEFKLNYDYEFISETKHLLFLLNYEFINSYETEAMSRNGGKPGGFYTPGWALPKATVTEIYQVYFNYIMDIDIFDFNIAKIKLSKYVFSKLLLNQNCSGFMVDYYYKNGTSTIERKLNKNEK